MVLTTIVTPPILVSTPPRCLSLAVASIKTGGYLSGGFQLIQTIGNPTDGIAINRALGILVHEMLTGEPPFGYEGGDELLQRIVAGLPGLDSENDEVDAGSDNSRFIPIVR